MEILGNLAKLIRERVIAPCDLRDAKDLFKLLDFVAAGIEACKETLLFLWGETPSYWPMKTVNITANSMASWFAMMRSLMTYWETAIWTTLMTFLWQFFTSTIRKSATTSISLMRSKKISTNFHFDWKAFWNFSFRKPSPTRWPILIVCVKTTTINKKVEVSFTSTFLFIYLILLRTFY